MTIFRFRTATFAVGALLALPLLGQKSVEMPKVTPEVYKGDIRLLPQWPQPATPFRGLKREHKIPNLKANLATGKSTEAGAPIIPQITAPMPATLQNFEGLNLSEPVTGGQAGSGFPPDVNGDVGPNHYIMGVNDSYAIYDKTGTRLAAFTENQLWLGVGSTKCNGNSFGDPIVLYDAFADRWILTHFAFSVDGTGDFLPDTYECIAVSRTNDPVAGGWNLYAFRQDPGGTGLPPVGTLNDYPKFGVWRDCLYMGGNIFTNSGYVGPVYASFSKEDMYAGLPATWSMVFLSGESSSTFSSFPAHTSGKTTDARPPSGRPAVFVAESITVFGWETRTFTPGANCGAGGTISAKTTTAHPSYSFLASGIPQPNGQFLDDLSDRVMQRVFYRKVGSNESYWVTNTTLTGNSSTGVARVQWAELRVTPNANPALAPTVTMPQRADLGGTLPHRWMPSLAADVQNNMAVGYSTSSSSQHPSIAYSGRLNSDPVNTLPQTETVMMVGTGSQSAGGFGRWGDYTSMSVDPVDDCTFWYANEYYAVTGTNWRTRIGSFKYPSCTAPTAGSNLTITKTHTGNFTPNQSGATFTITVTNSGDAATLGTVTVTDTLPAQFTAVSISGTGWTCTQPSGPCLRHDALAAGSSYPALTLTVNVGPSTGTFNNVASVSGGADMVYTNNSATDPTTVAVTPAPTVTSFKVLFGTQEYELIGSARNRLPWTITGIKVGFSAAITAANTSSLTGLTASGISGVGTNTVTWTINPVNLGSFASSLLGTGPNAISGAGGPIATFNQLVKVLYGDFNDDGNVNATDMTSVNNARVAPYNLFADVNGSGAVDLTDVTIVRSRIGTSLP